MWGVRLSNLCKSLKLAAAPGVGLDWLKPTSMLIGLETCT